MHLDEVQTAEFRRLKEHYAETSIRVGEARKALHEQEKAAKSSWAALLQLIPEAGSWKPSVVMDSCELITQLARAHEYYGHALRDQAAALSELNVFMMQLVPVP